MSDILLTAYDGILLGPIARILGWLMNGIYYLMSLIGIENVSVSIILFTVVIYAILFPLTYKQQKFSKLSQKMQPELNAIAKKYEGRKDQDSMVAMNTETQAVYEKYGVSMMGSCANLLVQMPLLLALYRVFMNVPAYVSGVKRVFTQPVQGNSVSIVDGIMQTSGFRDKMTQLVQDLGIFTQPMADFTVKDDGQLSNFVVDVLYKMNTAGWDQLRQAFPSLGDMISSVFDAVSHVNNFFGLNISDTPWHVMTTNFAAHQYLMVFIAIMIPVASYISQIVNIKIIPQPNTSSGDNDQNNTMAAQMKMMNNIMPLFSFVMCFTVPVGLGIYWTAGAVIRTIQSLILNWHFDRVDLDDIVRKNQEKQKKRQEKMGISENQISNAAHINTKTMVDAKKNSLETADKEMQLEKKSEIRSQAKPGSMTSKANLVKDFNERNSRK